MSILYFQIRFQIIGPHDEGIARAIKENLEPRTWDTHMVTSSPLLQDRTEEMRDDYFSYLQRLSNS